MEGRRCDSPYHWVNWSFWPLEDKSLTKKGLPRIVRYKMIRQIAEGGFSTVDLIEDCETGKKYALKRILCHSIEDQNIALQVGLVKSLLQCGCNAQISANY